MSEARVRLTIELEGDDPPTEFRVFRRGYNDSSKGVLLYDEQASRSVIKRRARHKVDCMIDLEHLSLDTESRSYNPDAQGWCELEDRAGELWASNVRWTDEGAERIRGKRQKYISPVVDYESSTGRVTGVFNLALTSLPAMYGAYALAANSVSLVGGETHAKEKGNGMKDDLKKALESLVAGDTETAAAILQTMIDASEEPSKDPPGEEMTEKKPEDEEAKAASARIVRLTGKPTLSAGFAEVEAWKRSHLALASREAELAKERATLESTERKSLAASLVKLGAETPHTSGLAAGKLVKRLADEPMEELRARVAALSEAKPDALSSKKPDGKIPAQTGGQSFEVRGKVIELSARELRICAEEGAKPEDYAANKLATGRA